MLAIMATIPVVCAVDEKNAPDEIDDGVIIEDPFTFLNDWNEHMKWGLSLEQIRGYSQNLEDQVLSKYYDTDNKYYHIKNLKKFSRELQDIIGISDDQASAFVIEYNAQMLLAWQKSEIPYWIKEGAGSLKISSALSIGGEPGSQSAPSARGKLLYAIIFTNFNTPSSKGDWKNNDMKSAKSRLVLGLNEIKKQSDPKANVSTFIVYFTVNVDAENIGDNRTAWALNGWMEQAAKNLGYPDTNQNGRYSDDMAEALKTISGADSVMLIYCTHDDKSSYAVGPDQGYADKAAVSFWTKGNIGSQKDISPLGHYEHEALHLFGALDEYEGPSYCGQPSILAVTPMSEMYTNTNNWNCSNSYDSVMSDPIISSSINTSSKKFIGWGDYDGDEILDPDDSEPWGLPASSIGIGKPGIFLTASDHRPSQINSDFIIDCTDVPVYWDGTGSVILYSPDPWIWNPNMGADDELVVTTQDGSLTFTGGQYLGTPDLTSIMHSGINYITLRTNDIYFGWVGLNVDVWIKAVDTTAAENAAAQQPVFTLDNKTSTDIRIQPFSVLTPSVTSLYITST